METLAVAIVLSTILFLVDRNRQWPKFWRFFKAASIVAFVAIVLFGGYSYYAQKRASANLPKPWDEARQQLANQ